MWILNKRKYFYTLSAVAFIASIVFIWMWGLKPSIEFTGGSIIESRYSEENIPTQEELQDSLVNAGFDGFSIRPADNNAYIVRTKPLSTEERQEITNILSREGSFIERFNIVGPTLGKELAKKATTSGILIVIAVVLYVAYAFRKVSKPVSSWTYGLVTIVTLAFDVLIPTGLFAVLGHFAGIEVDSLFITAMLVILGYSINDTIVVFDRVRENLAKAKEKNNDEPFNNLVGKSLNETFVRSINTSGTTLVALIILYFVGSTATQLFSLALGVGVIAGTFSSLFLAAPLLVNLAGVGKSTKDKN